MTQVDETFDFIVVGAGSAGCAVASRLSESGLYTVLLAEAGGRDSNPWIHVPLGTSRVLTNPAVNWLYQSEPEPNLGNRRIFVPRGKVLGGTSSINGMVYIRGHAADYDGWRARGNSGWSYRDVLPYFLRAEHQIRGADEFHGVGGPLWVGDQQHEPLHDSIIAAAEQSGFGQCTDFNGAGQDGFGYFQTTIRAGRRVSAAVAYLKPARRRGNLSVRTGCSVDRILIKDGRAVGILYRRKGRTTSVGCRREVIVCNGTFNSPKLLQLSGIGDPARLTAAGIAVVLPLAGVGQNLQEHFCTPIALRCRQPVTLNDVAASLPCRIGSVLRYAAKRAGPLSTNGILSGGFWRSDASKLQPDLECVVCNWSITGAEKSSLRLDAFSGFTIETEILQPQSRGTVTIASADPDRPPTIRFNFLDAAADRTVMVAGLKAMRRLSRAPALSAFVAEELRPGADINSDDEWLSYCREYGSTAFHPVGTCMMGDTPDAVVDARLRVQGIAGLRVADASIMPVITSGNTNAPTIMIGEKAAAMILEDAAA